MLETKHPDQLSTLDGGLTAITDKLGEHAKPVEALKSVLP